MTTSESLSMEEKLLAIVRLYGLSCIVETPMQGTAIEGVHFFDTIEDLKAAFYTGKTLNCNFNDVLEPIDSFGLSMYDRIRRMQQVLGWSEDMLRAEINIAPQLFAHLLEQAKGEENKLLLAPLVFGVKVFERAYRMGLYKLAAPL